MLLVGSVGLPQSVLADTANPPKIVSVKFEVGRTFSVGDLVTVDLRFTGGNPGIKHATMSLTTGDNSYNCLLMDTWNAAGSRDSIPERNRPESQLIRSYLKVSHDCLNGKNLIRALIEIVDQTDLKSELYTSFEVNVGGATHVPKGTLLPPMSDSKFSLNFLQKEYFLEDNQGLVQLPSKTEEGILIGWGAVPASVCNVKSDWPDFFPTKVQFSAAGSCELSASLLSYRSGIKNQSYFHKLMVSSREKAKAEAEAKAKAEAEAKAKAEAEAKAKAELAARELAEKPLCEARRKELTQLGETLIKYMKNNPVRAADTAKTVARLNSALNSSCVAEVTLLDFQREAIELMKLSSKKSTITCVKGKLTKKVTAVNPKCPSGYKKKKT